MYTGFESMIGLAFLFGIFSPFLSIGFVVLIFVAIVHLVGRGRSGGQPPAATGAPSNRVLLWRLLAAAAMAQGRHPGAGQPGSAELGARQDAINAGFDPTPRP
jgi:hypothetical protein